MTTENRGAASRSFVTASLPWFVGASALLVYLITLNYWISLLSLPTVARISGWLWQPEIGRPLTAVVLSPFRLLPEAWIPLAMNLFTAACAAAVLALLARSVALLPHDLTPYDPLRIKQKPASILSTPTAWIPPVLAAIVCGLQLSFWESATSATGEIINVLFFAYAIRCVLEFRMDPNQSWLLRSAFVYAAGMANDWVAVGYFPFYLAAIVMVKGFIPFWNPRFLLRMTLWGLAGLGLYLLLPVLQSLSADGWGFWPVLKANLKSQADALSRLQVPAFRVLILTSLLPLLVLPFVKRSHTVQFGDDTRLGILITRFTGHGVHGLIFIGSLWAALDPGFSPRRLPLGTPMLAYYFISAMVCGYCAGYFLLFGVQIGQRRPTKLPVVATWVLSCILPLALLAKNFGQIRITNGPAVHEFARELYDDLPPGKSVGLSENTIHCLLLRAELGLRGHDKEALLLETPSLVFPRYQEFMARRYKARWPESALTNKVQTVTPGQLQELIAGFAEREPVVYLHPSSGLFFEAYVDVPNGSIHRLVPRTDQDGLNRMIPDTIVATNEQIWQQRWTDHLAALAKKAKNNPQKKPSRSRTILEPLKLPPEQNITVSVLSAAYSKPLDYWGVQMQRLGRWQEAGVWFQRAIELKPGNLVARINLEYNERWQRGETARLNVEWVKGQFPVLFREYYNWWEALSDNGPVDEPTFLLQTGRIFLSAGNARQAVSSLTRCVKLAPQWLPPKLSLAQSHNTLREFAEALALTDAVQPSSRLLKGPALAQLLGNHVIALRGLGQKKDAAVYLEDFVKTYGEHNEVLSTAARLYAQGGQFERELDLLSGLTARETDKPQLFVRKGQAELRLEKYEPAIVTLTTALTLDPANDDARLLRAVACLRAGRPDAARNDYLELLNKPDSSQQALFGLGGVAWHEHDTNAIIEYYQKYLSNAVPDSPQSTIASQRLNRLTDE